MITSTADTSTVLASYKAERWTGMNEVPAIVANGYGDGRTVYVGCRLGRQGLAKSLPAMLGSMGLSDLAGDGRVLRVERADAAAASHFEFVFNRTHEPVTVDVEGEAIAVRSRMSTTGGPPSIRRALSCSEIIVGNTGL